jgi:hypothetical protein
MEAVDVRSYDDCSVSLPNERSWPKSHRIYRTQTLWPGEESVHRQIEFSQVSRRRLAMYYLRTLSARLIPRRLRRPRALAVRAWSRCYP